MDYELRINDLIVINDLVYFLFKVIMFFGIYKAYNKIYVFLYSLITVVMLRICTLFLLLVITYGKAFADINVELDVVFSDSTVQCRYLYVLCPAKYGVNDTLAVFDTLSFNGTNRVSLFYSAGMNEKNILSMVDSGGVHVVSKPFRVSSQRTTFAVIVGERKIKVTGKDYLYLRKNDDERSYYIFLLIFFVAKLLMTTIFVLFSKLPKRIIPVASGAFLLSAFFDWLFPLNYLYRFLLIIIAEYLLIALVGRKFISWLRAARLVLAVNIVGYGFIAFLYILYVFW